MQNRKHKYLSSPVKRYLVPVLTTLLIVALYHSIDIRLFNLDITKKVRLALFHLYNNNSKANESIVLLNIGRLNLKQLETKIDSLLKCYPRKIGVNLCHYDSGTESLIEHFREKRSVVIANCLEDQTKSLSRVVNDDNSVTHFKTDRKDYFEFKLDLFENRGKDVERINFIDPHKGFYRWELSNVALVPEYFQGKTVLIGYMGDYLTDSIYYFKNCRITPMNPDYGGEELLPDMFDTEISAVLVSQFNGRFIDEIEQLPRILLILLFCLLNVIGLTLAKTKWNTLNIIIAAILFILFSIISSFLVLFLFTKGYYLAFDELPLVLLITTMFTVGLNIFEKKINV